MEQTFALAAKRMEEFDLMYLILFNELGLLLLSVNILNPKMKYSF